MRGRVFEFTEEKCFGTCFGTATSSDITAVAFEEENVQLPMTSGCPWIGGSLVLGAGNALQAASDYASYLEQTQEEPEKN